MAKKVAHFQFKEEVEILSVKRKSDGQIFSVGDDIFFNFVENKKPFKIESIVGLFIEYRPIVGGANPIFDNVDKVEKEVSADVKSGQATWE